VRNARILADVRSENIVIIGHFVKCVDKRERKMYLNQVPCVYVDRMLQNVDGRWQVFVAVVKNFVVPLLRKVSESLWLPSGKTDV
jgi:hypothetical protein